MNENVFINFFSKIHLSIVDAKYLAAEALSAKTKSVLFFFISLLLLSLTISAVARSAKIIKFAPDILVSTLGVLKFQNYNLISPDSLISVEGWKIKELNELVSGAKIAPTVNYPILLSIGTDSVSAAQNPFIHIGRTYFTTNIVSAIFRGNPSVVQNVLWEKLLPAPNAVLDADFYRAQFSQIQNKISTFFAAFAILCADIFSAVLQIWISILIYLIFFGKKLRVAGRFRMLMLATIPYFILLPISIFAANGIAFTTDIALIGGLIMTFRATGRINEPLLKENNNETK